PARSHPALPTPSAQPATNPAYQEATRTPDHDPPNGTTSPYPILPTHQPHPQHPRRTIGNSLWKRIPTGKVDSNPSARAQRRTRERNARTATETGARPPAESRSAVVGSELWARSRAAPALSSQAARRSAAGRL